MHAHDTSPYKSQTTLHVRAHTICYIHKEQKYNKHNIKNMIDCAIL